MDATREHLWGQLLLERRLLSEADLQRLVQQRDAFVRGGHPATVGSLMVHHKRLDSNAYQAMSREVEVRGRACGSCKRVYLAPSSGASPACAACGAPHAGLRPPSGSYPAQQAHPMASGQFRAQPSPFASGQFRASQAPMASGQFQAQQFQPQQQHPMASGQFQAQQSGYGQPGYGQPGATPYGSGQFQAQQFGGQQPGGQALQQQQHPMASGQFQSSLASGHFQSQQFQPQQYGQQPPGTPGSGLDASLASMRFNAPQSTPAEETDGSSGELGVGKRFGGYEILKELGRGGMGVVYKVRSPKFPDGLALKVLLAGEFASPKLMKRFREEAKLAEKLDHSNIVAVRDVGDVDGIPFYAMDFIEGSELQDLIREKNLSIRRGVEILVEVAKAAHHAHEKGIVHRDLKPSNVLVSSEGKPYIMDFGLAKNLESDQGLTKSGVAIGTPYYMPPEQARGQHREMDARSDVYALGAILFEILTRRVPFTAKTQNELLRKIIEEDPPEPRQIRPGVPPALETVCLKALAKLKSDRYDDALAFARDLERFLAGEQVEAKRLSPVIKWIRKAKKNKTITLTVAGAATVLVVGGLVANAIISKNKADLEAHQEEQDALAQQQADEQAAQQALLEEQRQRDAQRTQLLIEAKDLLSEALEHYRNAVTNTNASRARDYLRQAEDCLSEAWRLEEQAQDAPRPETAYQRALVRRVMCRWDAALEDFAQAGQDESFRARANLGRGTILLRAEADRQGSAQAFRQAMAAPGQVAMEERAAEVIAQGYLAFLLDDADSARRLIKDARDRGRLGSLEAEANGLLAHICRSVGDPLGGDSYVDQGLRAAELAVNASRIRFAFLIDRAILYARSGDLERAEEDLHWAQALNVEGDGIEAQMVRALIFAMKPDARSMQAAVDSASDMARRVSPAKFERTRTFLTALQRALERRGGMPPPRAQDPEPDSSGGGGQVYRDDFGGNAKFPANANRLNVDLQVTADVQGLRVVATSTEGLRLQLVPKNPQSGQEPWATEGSGELSLTVLKRDDPQFRVGDYQVVIQRGSSGQELTFNLQVEFFKPGDALPSVWQEFTGDEIQVTNPARAREIIGEFRAGRFDAALQQWEEFERTQDPIARSFRVEWLGLLGRYEQAIALGEDLREQLPESDRVAFLLGGLYLEVDQPERAIELLRPLAEQQPLALEVWSLLVKSLTAAGQYGEAEAACQQLLEIDPHSQEVRLLRGVNRLREGDNEGGRALLREGLGVVHPSIEPDLSMHVIDALLDQGDSTGAMLHTDQMLGLFPEGSVPPAAVLLRCRALVGVGGREAEARTLLQQFEVQADVLPTPLVEEARALMRQLED